MLQLSWSRSLAAAAVLVLLGPIAGDTSADQTPMFGEELPADGETLLAFADNDAEQEREGWEGDARDEEEAREGRLRYRDDEGEEDEGEQEEDEDEDDSEEEVHLGELLHELESSVGVEDVVVRKLLSVENRSCCHRRLPLTSDRIETCPLVGILSVPQRAAGLRRKAHPTRQLGWLFPLLKVVGNGRVV